MTLTSIAGYGVVLALAVAFFGLGLQGCWGTGLRLTPGVRLKGWPGRVLGGILILVGAVILVAGGYDFVDRHIADPIPKNPRKAEKSSAPLEVAGDKPDKEPPIPPVPKDGEKKPDEPITGGVERWNRFGVIHGWMYHDDNGFLTFDQKHPSREPLWHACSVGWVGPETFKGLHEPNAPFGLYLTSLENGDDALECIARFQQLQALDLSLSSVSEKGLSALGRLPKLEWLTLSSSKATNGDFRKLAQCKRIVYLDLGSTNVSDASLKEIATLEHLKELHLFATPISDEGVKELARLSKMEILSFQGQDSPPSHITDAGLKALAGLKHLKSLSLHSTAVTDEGMKYLAGHEQLADLNLTLTGITDQGLKELAGVRHLKKLSLTATKITDTGLKELSTLGGLEELSLGFVKVTDEGLADLQKKLPKLKIR